jgi:hypothetical protein
MLLGALSHRIGDVRLGMRCGKEQDRNDKDPTHLLRREELDRLLDRRLGQLQKRGFDPPARLDAPHLLDQLFELLLTTGFTRPVAYDEDGKIVRKHWQYEG